MSALFNLNWRDLFKGLIVAVFTGVLTTASSMIQNSSLALTKANGLLILSSAVASGLAYLAKNLLSDNQGKFGGKL